MPICGHANRRHASLRSAAHLYK